MLPHTHISTASELSQEALERYVLGRTQDQAEVAQVEHHLTGCRTCTERADKMTRSIAAMIIALRDFDKEDYGNRP